MTLRLEHRHAAGQNLVRADRCIAPAHVAIGREFGVFRIALQAAGLQSAK